MKRFIFLITFSIFAHNVHGNLEHLNVHGDNLPRDALTESCDKKIVGSVLRCLQSKQSNNYKPNELATLKNETRCCLAYATVDCSITSAMDNQVDLLLSLLYLVY